MAKQSLRAFARGALLTLCHIILINSLSLAAFGQDAWRLEETLVTAQRKVESAQDAPISLTSFDQQALDTLGIANIADLDARVINFIADPFPSSNQTLRLFIRGLGITDVQITQDPAVGVYLDGVYIARSTGLATEVADLARIEVLRGPQGTLYGRNTTGGALNLVTARPDPSTLSFRQDLGAGNRDRLRLRSTLNLPVSKQHALKFAALFDERDGFMANDGPGGDFGDRSAEAYRFDWRWQHGERFTLDYAWDTSQIEYFNYTPQAQQPGVTSGTPADVAIISSRRFVPYAQDRAGSLSTSQPLLPNDTDIQGHALTLEWASGNNTFKSITAWRELQESNYIEFASGASEEYRVDFSAVTLAADSAFPITFDSAPTRTDQEQFSQELQWLGNWGEHLEFIAGLYYFREDARENWLPDRHIISFPLIETDDTARTVNIRGEDNEIENEAKAVFGQATWTPDLLNKHLHLTLGWRYSRDTRRVTRSFRQENYIDSGDSVVGPLEVIDFRADARRDFDDNALNVMLAYDWTDNIRVYAKVVEAYKSGGFNTRDPDPAFFEEGFDEENNRTGEFGFKGELRDNQLRINGALFYSRISDMQLNFLLPNTISDTRVFNTGTAELSGLELEVVSMPVPGLVLALNYAYLDSNIEDVDDPFTAEPRSFAFSNAPRHSATLNMDAFLPPVGPLQPALNINYGYVGERSGDNSNTVRDAYQLLNGRLSLLDIEVPAGRITCSAWIKNALDEEYVVFVVDNLPHASRAVLWGEPRTWGVDFSYRY
ncbi:MAG: TonB-dependent receptor [Pseudomonadota bacterium]